MFGELKVSKMLSLSELETLDQAAAKLLEFAEYPQVLRWFQLPTALVVFVAHAECPQDGAVYIYDRKRCVWLWVDFDDQNYGGYSPAEFDCLIDRCHFLRLAASPSQLGSPVQWLVTPGQRPTVLEDFRFESRSAGSESTVPALL